MNDQPQGTILKSAAIGALSGALVFFALSVVKAQSGLTVNDVRHNPKQFVGTTVSVTGIASNIRLDSRMKDGQKVPYIKLNLYEVDQKKGTKGSHYIYVAIPSAQLRYSPKDGDSVTATGALDWPYEIAKIDE